MTGIHRYTINIPSRMNKQEFVACFGGIYEHSAWIAEAAWENDLEPVSKARRDSAEGIREALRAVVDSARKEDKKALLCAHPDLAGKLAIAGKLTNASASEQASADLESCSPQEFRTFQSLNAQYKNKYNFPFILAVRDYKRTEILEIFEKRLHNDTDTEFAAAIEQVHRIAYLRLRDIS